LVWGTSLFRAVDEGKSEAKEHGATNTTLPPVGTTKNEYKIRKGVRGRNVLILLRREIEGEQ